MGINVCEAKRKGTEIGNAVRQCRAVARGIGQIIADEAESLQADMEVFAANGDQPEEGGATHRDEVALQRGAAAPGDSQLGGVAVVERRPDVRHAGREPAVEARGLGAAMSVIASKSVSETGPRAARARARGPERWTRAATPSQVSGKFQPSAGSRR